MAAWLGRDLIAMAALAHLQYLDHRATFSVYSYNY